MYSSVAIEFVSKSKLPTAFGDFEIIAFQDQSTGEEHIALAKGINAAPINLYLSECIQNA